MRRRGLRSVARRGGPAAQTAQPGNKSVVLTALPAGSMKENSQEGELCVAKSSRAVQQLMMLQGRRCVHKESESRLAMVGLPPAVLGMHLYGNFKKFENCYDWNVFTAGNL